MLVFTGRLIVFLSLLTWRIIESIFNLAVYLIVFSFNSACKNLNLFISERFQSQTDLGLK